MFDWFWTFKEIKKEKWVGCVVLSGVSEGAEERQSGLQQAGTVQDAIRLDLQVTHRSDWIVLLKICEWASFFLIFRYFCFLCVFRPVFKDASGTLDKNARFSALYRQESSKASDEDLFKMLADFRKLVLSCVNEHRCESITLTLFPSQRVRCVCDERCVCVQTWEDVQASCHSRKPGRQCWQRPSWCHQ